uniref:Secreted protein n=1 Tax=Haemonchus contortus TaxID=6289 RepID=A0A7I4YHS2_HAECO
MRLITTVTVCSIIATLCSSNPWYHPSTQSDNTDEEDGMRQKASFCAQDCMTTMDCDAGLSCFHATNENKGCCLMALKPNETGCVLDDQCRRACESTVCEKTHQGSRCMCEKGRHFLFNKCWTKCPEFAYPEPVVDELGFSSCTLRTDLRTASSLMRRFRRELKSNFC